jgi:hypothetical protein
MSTIVSPIKSENENLQTVYDYYYAILSTKARDESLRELPVKSNCGEDCKRIIDATKEYLDCHELACGIDNDERQRMLRKCGQIISIFWRG